MVIRNSLKTFSLFLKKHKSMKNIALIIIAFFSLSVANAQTADVTIGCFPLQVEFTSPNSGANFWQFGDNTNSDVKDPSHNYTEPGIYTVELFEGVGGPKVGEIIITVLSPPEIMIGASERMGCSPFQVQFTNESIIDPNAGVTGYFWTFGDGGSSTLENPTYVYQSEGTYDVSLRIESSLESCTDTKNFEDYVMVSGNINAGFSVDNTVICSAPATFNITNNTVDQAGYTYLWDFDNGVTSTDFNPPAADYTSDGSYTITMTVDNGEGCVVTLTRIVTVGKPQINITVPDTVCIGEPFIINNTTQASIFSWNFGSNANPPATNLRNPIVFFNSGGPQIVNFSAIASSTCQADTVFTIFVDDPSAAFTIDPVIQCFEQSTYVFTHPVSGYNEYSWYIKEFDINLSGGPEQTFVYNEPFRDSFYINRLDTFTVLLSIETQFGCEALDSTEFYHRAPRAHFVPDISRGCAPLTINFDEVSESVEDIVSWDWVFGDGQTASTTTPDDMTHTYTVPGEYYVKLSIENNVGCTDTSEGVWIYVGEPIDSDFTFDATEICLNDSVNFEALNLDSRIDAWHFNTDDGRISDCYETADASHVFEHAPGVYPVTLTVEYNGCFNEINNGETITVNGSKSIIKFMTNCDDPYTVMFQDSSLNATTTLWFINGDTINMDTITGDVFNYTFDTTGDYTIKLWTDDDTMCDPDSATVEVYIRDIEANFEFPEHICAYAPVELDASSSIDVDNTCSKGYEWFGIAVRPRQIDYPVVQTAYNPGEVIVRLVVEDVNGCKDEITKTSEAFEVRADFLPSKDKICYPSTMSFEDLSVGDTTLAKWSWSFGSEDQNPTDVQFNTGESPFLPIELTVEDVLGCTDSIIINLPVYQVASNIMFEPIVCVGSTIDFTATDFTQEGSFLNFNWEFGPAGALGTSTEQNPSFTVNNPGATAVSLSIKEDSTGCDNTYNFSVTGIIPPIAQFSVDEENPDKICPEESLDFINESIVDGPPNTIGYLWDFGDAGISFLENPSIFFENGTYDVALTVSSIYGCSDTDTIQLTFEGPDGDFITDKDFFCLGETVTFNLVDSVMENVVSYEWDFGDGNTLANTNPAPNTYTFLPDTLAGTLKVSLILFAENDCKNSIVKFLELSDLVANFGIIEDTMNICNKEIQFIDSSRGGVDTYFWNFGNGETSTEQNPVYTYTEADTFNISLTVQSAGALCESTAIDTFINTALNKAQVPTVFSPNNDNRNDFFDVIIPEDQRECVEVIKSKIYNRWGNLIYDNTLPPEGWDGRYENGDMAPAEIYTYVLEVTYSTGETEPFRGTFTLIR